MKKLKGLIKGLIQKHNNLIVLIMIAIAVIPTAFYYLLTPTDMLWNFGNIYKLFLGQKMYVDANIIITPLFFTIGKWIFKVFGANFLVYNFYGYIMDITMYFLIYKILRKIDIKAKMASFCTILIILITQTTITANGANYNTLAFIFMELGLLINLQTGKNKKIITIINGILATVTFFTYQKAGAGYFIAIIIETIFEDESQKNKIKEICTSTISAIISFTCIALYMHVKGLLFPMINMCILGIRDFANNNFKLDISVFLLAFMIIASLIFAWIIIKKEKIKKNPIIQLVAFAIGNSVICIPILNYYHILIAIIFYAILIIKCLYICFEDMGEDKKINKILNFTIAIIILTIIANCTYKINLYISNIKKSNLCYKDMYYGAVIDEKIKDNIQKVNDYLIEQKKYGKNVVILSSYAMLYPENYENMNGMFDLPNSGNYGLGGELTLIRKIKELSEDTVILVQNKERSTYEIYQYASKAREFVHTNYQYLGSIENYDIYAKNIKNGEK